MRVLLVTSDREHCGIREYSRMLMEEMEAYSPDIELVEFPFPDYAALLKEDVPEFDILHLNHHAALMSSWKPEHIHKLRDEGVAVVVTQHDTFEKLSIMKERGLHDFSEVADHLVIHEPVEGLRALLGWGGASSGKPNVTYLRQPVWQGELEPHLPHPLGRPEIPVIGSAGFPYPWKNYDQLCEAAAAAGWGVLLIAPGATDEQEEGWARLNPKLAVEREFLPRGAVVGMLGSCTATAFLYTTGNSGTSGAIRMGIAARRPLLAYRGCRQFRDLEFSNLPGPLWVNGQAGLAHWLKRFKGETWVQEEQARRVASLADAESWEEGAKVYAGIYKEVLEKKNARPD